MTDLIANPAPSATEANLVAPIAATRRPEPLFDAARYDEVGLPPQIWLPRRVMKSRWLMHYYRLAAAMVTANLVIAVLGLTQWSWFDPSGLALGAIGRITVVNFAAAIIIRQQYVINLLFKVATSVPTSWPLRIRWTAGKVYHFGGIHVGGAIMGSLWFVVFMGAIAYHAIRDLPGASTALLVVTGLLIGLLAAIIGFALPRFRAKHHDNFEKVHRFGGWATLVLFWVHTALFIAANRAGDSFGSALVGSATFWLLVAITSSVILPWLRLRKVPVEITRPSDHVALVRFNHGVTPFAGSSTTISRDPLREWHSFANVPSPNEDGFRLTISRSGDWTGKFIDDMPSHVWVKGITTAGVGNVDKLFKRVVWIATGSGIGPTLPHLLAQTAPAHLVWATRDPWATYGHQLVDEILDVQPNATIWDTGAQGKPDMVKLAYRAVQAFDAEAVICISNKSLTWQVVEGMERIGIPAYGAIWDS